MFDEVSESALRSRAPSTLHASRSIRSWRNDEWRQPDSQLSLPVMFLPWVKPRQEESESGTEGLESLMKFGISVILPEHSCSWDEFGCTGGNNTTGDLGRVRHGQGVMCSDGGGDKDTHGQLCSASRRKACTHSRCNIWAPLCDLSAGRCGSEYVHLLLQWRKGICFIYTNLEHTEQTGLNWYRMVMLSTCLKHAELAATWSMCYF